MMLEGQATTCWNCSRVRPASPTACPSCDAPMDRRASVSVLTALPVARPAVPDALEQLGLSFVVLMLRVFGVIGLVGGGLAAYSATQTVKADGEMGAYLFVAGLMSFALLWAAAYVLLLLRSILGRLDKPRSLSSAR